MQQSTWGRGRSNVQQKVTVKISIAVVHTYSVQVVWNKIFMHWRGTIYYSYSLVTIDNSWTGIACWNENHMQSIVFPLILEQIRLQKFCNKHGWQWKTTINLLCLNQEEGHAEVGRFICDLYCSACLLQDFAICHVHQSASRYIAVPVSHCLTLWKLVRFQNIKHHSHPQFQSSFHIHMHVHLSNHVTTINCMYTYNQDHCARNSLYHVYQP